MVYRSVAGKHFSKECSNQKFHIHPLPGGAVYAIKAALVAMFGTIYTCLPSSIMEVDGTSSVMLLVRYKHI